jgi:hypothetical protein
MSYTLALTCGCVVYVACHPRTGLAHTRVIELRDEACHNRRHRTGARLWLWEMLPDPLCTSQPQFVHWRLEDPPIPTSAR